MNNPVIDHTIAVAHMQQPLLFMYVRTLILEECTYSIVTDKDQYV